MDDFEDTYTVEVQADTTGLRKELKSARSLGDSFAKSMTRAFSDLVVKGKDLGETFRSLALRLSELALKAALKPLENLFSGAVSSLVSGVLPFANGGVINRGLPVPFAQGGVVASPTTFALAGGRTGLMGERGPEAIMPLARGADGRLGVRAAPGAGRAVTVNFNVTSPDAESFRRSETQMAAVLARVVSQGNRNL